MDNQKNDRTGTPATETTFKRDLVAILPNLRAFAVSLCGRHDVADDLVQETVMRAWAKQESFEPGTNLTAWLFTILRNNYFSQLRKRGREIQDVDGAMSAKMATHPTQYGKLDMQDFQRALGQLPADQREALILVGASGFAYEEAADICGCAVGTVKSRVSRARKALQDLLAVSGEADYGPDSVSAPIVGKAYVA